MSFTEPHGMRRNADATGSYKRYFVKENSNNPIVCGHALHRVRV